MCRSEPRLRSLHTLHIEMHDCILTQTCSTRCVSTRNPGMPTTALALLTPRFRTMFFRTEFTSGTFYFTPSLHLQQTNPNSPGRWFASAGMKLVLVNLLERYEIRFEEGTSNPRPISLQASFTPNMTAKIQLRKRRTN